MWNETETLAVVYNGEIYNFRSLRKDSKLPDIPSARIPILK